MRLLKYCVVGGTAAIVDISLFTIFAGYFKWTWWLVSICTFIIATYVNYFLSIRYVFESGIRHSKNAEIAAVYAVSFFGLAINQVVLYAAINWMQWSLIISKVFATAIVFTWNYLSRKHYIF
jgi:putative flippase GtrA